jgi:CheY-like chemotaxis protein
VVAHDTSRILVVDDEANILTFAGWVLRDAGYEVVVASNGPEALRLVEAQRRQFDLFVIDLLMPQMRGDELARHLRQQMNSDVKVLYFTGYSDQLFKEKKTGWKHEALVDKPVSGTGLRDAVSLLLLDTRTDLLPVHAPRRDDSVHLRERPENLSRNGPIFSVGNGLVCSSSSLFSSASASASARVTSGDRRRGD